MNQVVHIFRKDCRRLWRVIAAVLVLTVLHGYGEVINPASGNFAGFSPDMLLLLLVGLSGILLPIALFLLVVSVIQEESMVGSNEFWLTRPYSRLSLFLEKLLFVLVWAVLPMLLHDVVLIHYFGLSLSSAFGLLLWKSARFGLFLFVAAALAVLSASFGRALLLGIGAILLTLFTFYAVMENAGDRFVGAEIATYVFLVLLAVAAVGALSVVAFQYRFRITAVAAVLGVMVILACALIFRFWPHSLYFARRNAPPLLQSVQLRPDASLKNLAPPRPAQDAAAQSHTVYYPFQATGLSDNVGFDLGLDAHFESPGQKLAPVSLGSTGQVRFQPPPVGSPRFADAGGPDQLVAFDLYFAGDFDRLKTADGTLSGTLFLEGYRSDVVSMPVPSPGQQQDFAIADRKCTFMSFTREHKVAFVFDCAELEPGNTARFQVRLLQDNRTIVPSQSQGDTSSAGSWPAFLSPIAKTHYQCEFILPEADGSAAASIRGREMLVSAEQSVGREQRDFRIEHFRPADFGLQAWEQRGVVRPAE